MGTLQSFLSDLRTEEQRRLEETIRVNRERSMVDSLAPEKWEELKQEIKKTCPDMKPLDLRIEEHPNSLVVTRFTDDVPTRTLTLIYDQAIPRIIWKCHPRARSGSITFSLQNSELFYVSDGRVGPIEEILIVLLSCFTT
jgi:hypothetical protein